MSAIGTLERELGMRCPTDLADFLTDDRLRSLGWPGVLAEPLDVGDILEARLAGLPIDLVPLAGDGTGDHLCARLGPDGAIEELVLWAHDDLASALPFASTLAEAVLVAAAAAERDDHEDACASGAVAWALERLRDATLAERWRRAGAANEPRARLLVDDGVGVAWLGMPDVGVHGVRTWLRDAHFIACHDLGEALARAPSWYTLDGLPEVVLRALERERIAPLAPRWDVMESASGRVLARRHDIGWAWVLAGDLAGRRADGEGARRAIGAAARCLARTFGSHGPSLLVGIQDHADLDDPLVLAFVLGDRAAMAELWQERARAAEAAGDGLEAWRAWYRSIHHLPRADRDDGSVLDAYARAAGVAGARCWQRLVARRESW
ncbi:MAG: SMI1/KNR4 family protein [Deltaproteobacteria bacterium]|nr:SMI1/KNR4 family protein [Deltaproteobacteria bacterium]